MCSAAQLLLWCRRKKDHGRAEALLLAAWGLGLRLPFDGWLPPAIQSLVSEAKLQAKAKRVERAAIVAAASEAAVARAQVPIVTSYPTPGAGSWMVDDYINSLNEGVDMDSPEELARNMGP